MTLPCNNNNDDSSVDKDDCVTLVAAEGSRKDVNEKNRVIDVKCVG